MNVNWACSLQNLVRRACHKGIAAWPDVGSAECSSGGSSGITITSSSTTFSFITGALMSAFPFPHWRSYKKLIIWKNRTISLNSIRTTGQLTGRTHEHVIHVISQYKASAVTNYSLGESKHDFKSPCYTVAFTYQASLPNPTNHQMKYEVPSVAAI